MAVDKKVLMKAYILGDGKIIKEDDIPKATATTDQLKDTDMFKSMFAENKIYKPEIALSQLVDLLYTNFIHFRCVNQKVSDVTGQGYNITTGTSEGDETNKENIEKIKTFFKKPNMSETFNEVFSKFWKDYEGLAQAYLEISLDKDKEPIAMWQIPAQTMRICKGNNFYVQILNEKKKFFPKFGVNPKKLLSDIAKLGIEASQISEHFVFSMHNNSPKDVNYGVPDYYPVISSILLDKYRAEYNISFFENNAVPRYAVIITGTDNLEEVEGVIKSFFQSHIKGQAHKTLVLSVGDKDVEIKFEKLAVEMKDGSFRMLHQDALYDICLAHGIPPRWLGIAEKGQLGGGSENSSQARNYKTNYVTPKQKLLAGKLTEIIIADGFKSEEIELKFKEIDITDQLNDAKVGETYLKYGALSINEFRTMYLSLPNIETHSASKHIIYSKGQAIFLEDLDEGKQLIEEEKSIKKEEQSLFEIFSGKIANEYTKSLDALKEELIKSEEKNRVESRNIFEKMFHFFKSAGKKQKAEKKYTCECIECGHTIKTDEHCKNVSCSECGGETRRKERPGPGTR